MTSNLANIDSEASKEVKVSVTVTEKIETIAADGRKSTTLHERRTDAKATLISAENPVDAVDESDADAVSADDSHLADALSDAETGSSVTSGPSEHPDLPEEQPSPKVSVVQHVERTERTITDTELPIGSLALEGGVDGGDNSMPVDIDQILSDMLQAGLHPRGPNGKVQASARQVQTKQTTVDSMRAERDRRNAEKAKKEAEEKAAAKVKKGFQA